MNAQRARDEPSSRLRQAKLRMLGRNDDVARKRHLQSAPESEAVHPRNDRLVQVEPAREPSEAGRWERKVRPLAGGKPRGYYPWRRSDTPLESSRRPIVLETSRA